FGNSFFIKGYIGTLAVLHHWSNIHSVVWISSPCSLFFKGFNTFLSKVRFYFVKNTVQYFKLVFIQRSSHISFHTTCTFTFRKVANKFFGKNFLRNQFIVYLNHNFLK